MISNYYNFFNINRNAAKRITDGFILSNRWTVISQDFRFSRLGRLKSQYAAEDRHNLTLERALPQTSSESAAFVTIGYQVRAYVDDLPIYSFDDPLHSTGVMGVKVHVFPLPDGPTGRELRLELITGDPDSVAVSAYFMLDDAQTILKSLLLTGFPKIAFSLLYLSLGLLLLIGTLILSAYRKNNLSFLFLSILSISMGIRILANIGFIAYYLGPSTVYWTVSFLNLLLPITALLFVASEKRFKGTRLLTGYAAVQGLALASWCILSFLGVGWNLAYWHIPLFIGASVILIGTLVVDLISDNQGLELAVSVITIILTSYVNAYFYYLFGKQNTMDFALIIFTFPVIILMSGKLIQQSIQKEFRISTENASLRIQGDLLRNNYVNMQNYIDETKKIWHDIDKHFGVIGNLVTNNEYEKLNQYLAEIGYQFNRTKNNFLSENKLVNAILTDKVAEAEKSGIRVTCMAFLPEELKIAGSDLCSLLVNALDNAIEACRKIPTGREKTIDIRITMKNDFLYIGITNTLLYAPQVEGEAFVSSKSDQHRHGYGIEIIKSITAKYGGVFDYQSDKSTFKLQVALRDEAPG